LRVGRFHRWPDVAGLMSSARTTLAATRSAMAAAIARCLIVIGIAPSINVPPCVRWRRSRAKPRSCRARRAITATAAATAGTREQAGLWTGGRPLPQGRGERAARAGRLKRVRGGGGGGSRSRTARTARAPLVVDLADLFVAAENVLVLTLYNHTVSSRCLAGTDLYRLYRRRRRGR
jgi:hypothetical protein